MNKIAQAEVYGNQDFKSGVACAPAISKDCMSLLESGNVSETHSINIKIMRAWSRGWMNANLAG